MTRGISGGSRLSASAGDAEAETALFQSIGRVKSEEDVENSDSTSEVFARSISIARRQVEISLQSDELLRKFQGRLRASLERQRILIAAIKSAKNNQQEPPRKGHGSSSVDDDSEESENEEPRSVVRLGPDPSRRVVVKASNSSPWKSGDKSSFLRPSGSRFPPRNDEVPSSSADAAGAMNMIAMSSGVGIGGRGGSENTSSRPRLPPTAALMANDGLRMTDARSIQQEMESQLSMHRQMLLRKTDQLTLFETEGEQAAASPVPAMEAAAPWNFEATDLDEELFDFLNE